MLRLITGPCALAMLCIAPPAIAAPDLNIFAKQVDSFVEAEMQTEKVPGVAVAVLHKGEIVIAKGYGRATLEHDVPVTRKTIFQSGSVGKMFTAAAVMTQVEAGKIGLDDPVGKYLPGAPASWRSITVRHLLGHTSGISDYTGGIDYRRDYSDEELVKFAFALPLEFEPGARWDYSNTGYMLLGIIVKRATGTSYLDILDKNVFKPLGMATARGISDADIVPNRASGYQRAGDRLVNQDFVSPPLNTLADGSLYLSLDDMIAWAQGVRQGRVLSAASWKQTYTPVQLLSGKTYPYGFGWMVDNTGSGQPRHYHSGSWQGFRTYYSHYLGDDLSVIILANADDAETGVFAEGVAGLWDAALVAPPPRPKADPAMDRRVTALIEKTRAGALRHEDVPFASADFVQFANENYAPALAALGPLTKLELTGRRELGDDAVYAYTASFGNRRVTVEYGVAPGNRVSSFSLEKDKVAGGGE